MLLSYKPLHLEAQQHLQEEGCVVDISANFAGASKRHDMIRSITHKPPNIFLKTATIPTYYGISIAIPRYIAMQLSTVLFIMTRIIIVILPCMIM